MLSLAYTRRVIAGPKSFLDSRKEGKWFGSGWGGVADKKGERSWWRSGVNTRTAGWQMFSGGRQWPCLWFCLPLSPDPRLIQQTQQSDAWKMAQTLKENEQNYQKTSKSRGCCWSGLCWWMWSTRESSLLLWSGLGDSSDGILRGSVSECIHQPSVITFLSPWASLPLPSPTVPFIHSSSKNKGQFCAFLGIF